jgi:hypothetical protein
MKKIQNATVLCILFIITRKKPLKFSFKGICQNLYILVWKQFSYKRKEGAGYGTKY